MSSTIEIISHEEIQSIINKVEAEKETVLFENPNLKNPKFHNSMPPKIGEYLLEETTDEDIAYIAEVASFLPEE